MEKKIQGLIQELTEKLKTEVSKGDNEVVHGIYDTIMEIIVEEYEPELKKELDKIVKGVGFWYA